jgi:hypothetical protein
MPSSPWSSEATYNFSDQTPLLNSGKTQEQIDQENLDRETKAAIQKSRQIKKGKEKEKAAGRTQRNRQTWNPAKVAQEAIARPLSGVSAKLDEVLAPVNKVVADIGEQVDKNLYGIKDTQELAKRRRLRSNDKAEKAKLNEQFKKNLEPTKKSLKPLVETAKVVLKGSGPGIIEDYGSQLIKAGQEGMARVGEAIGRPVAPEQDPRSDRYIKAQIDFGLTPDDPTAAGAAEFLKLVNGMRFLNRVAPQVGPDAGKLKKLIRSGGLDFFAGFIHADTSEKGGPTLGARLEEVLPANLKPLVPKALTADPNYDSEARYRIIAGLEDMGLGKVAEAAGAVFKALDIFQTSKNAVSKINGVLRKKTTAEAIDDSIDVLKKELDQKAKDASVKEVEESLRWDDVNQLRRDEILNKIDNIKERQSNPWEDATELKKQLDNANDELKDMDNTILSGVNNIGPGVKSNTRIETAADIGKQPESLLQNRIWITDAATKRANMTGGWKAKIDEALESSQNKNQLDALYRRFGEADATKILKALDAESFKLYEDVLNTAKSPNEVTEAMLKAFREEGQTFIGEAGTEQIKTPALRVTQAMIRRLGEKASNIGQDALMSEANGITDGNYFDRLVDQAVGLIMLRKEAWSLETGRRLAAGKRWNQLLDEVVSEGSEPGAKDRTFSSAEVMRKWADYVKDLARSNDPKYRDEARQFYLAMTLAGGDPSKVINYGATLIKYSGKRVLGMFYNNILSAPKTFIRNLSGTFRLVMTPTMIGLRGLAEGDDTLIASAGAGYAALFQGSLEAAQVAATTFKTQVPASWSAASVLSRAETQSYLNALEMTADTPAKKMVAGHLRWLDAWIKYTEIPSRLMMTSDDFITTMAVRQKINMEAFKSAADKGGTNLAANIEMATKALERGFDPKTGQVTDEALKKYGMETNYTNDPGYFARQLELLVSGGPDAKIPVGKFIMPFIRTPANIMAYQTSFTPLIGKFMGGYRAALEAGDELALAELRGRESVGALVISLGYSAGTSGMMTGNIPFDPDERERWRQQGIQPRSVKIGDKWVSYGWFEPLSNWMAAAADLGMLSRYGEINELNKVAETLLYGFTAGFTEKSYLANLDGLSVIFNPQDAFAQLTGKKSNIPGNPNNFLDLMAGVGIGAINNLIPYTAARRAWANSSDPYYREYDSFYQKTMAQIWPDISKNAPFEPDILTGKPMLRSTGGWMNANFPFETMEENRSPVAQKLMEMNVWHKGNFKTASTGQVYTGLERAQIKALVAKYGLEQALAKHFASKEFKADEQRTKEGSLSPSERLVEPWYKRRTEEIFMQYINAAKQEVEATNPDFIKRKAEFLNERALQSSGTSDLGTNLIKFGNPLK